MMAASFSFNVTVHTCAAQVLRGLNLHMRISAVVIGVVVMSCINQGGANGQGGGTGGGGQVAVGGAGGGMGGLAVGGGDGANGGGSGRSAGDGGFLLEDGGFDVGVGPIAVVLPSGAPSSSDLISAAQDAGLLTEERALIYKLYSDFGDPALPTQYRGNDSAVVEGTGVAQMLSWIDRVGEANVSSATLELVDRFSYALQSGAANWKYDSHTSSCDFTGTKSLALDDALPIHFFTNSAVGGAAQHGVSFAGFLGFLSGPFSVNYTCTDSQGQVTSGANPYFTSLDIHVSPDDKLVRIDAATGLSVSGTQFQTGDPSASGSWTFVGSAR